MLFVIIMIFGLLLLFGGILSFEKQTKHDRDNAISCIVWGCFVVLPLITALGGSRIASLNENSQLLVMEENLEAYRQTVVYMNEIAVVDNRNSGFLQNFSQSSNTSLCLVQYRNQVVTYNKMISYRKVIQGNFWIGIFVAKLPPGIEIIEFYTKQEHQY